METETKWPSVSRRYVQNASFHEKSRTMLSARTVPCALFILLHMVPLNNENYCLTMLVVEARETCVLLPDLTLNVVRIILPKQSMFIIILRTSQLYFNFEKYAIGSPWNVARDFHGAYNVCFIRDCLVSGICSLFKPAPMKKIPCQNPNRLDIMGNRSISKEFHANTHPPAS